MTKHINFLGYSLWVQDYAEPTSDKILTYRTPLYSPIALAVYCFFTNFGIGTLLYSINVCRRGYLWRGRAIATLSAIFIIVEIVEIFNSTSNGHFLNPARSILNILVAFSLYSAEKPHFNRAMRNGIKPARWWLPLVWIVIIEFLVLILLLL